MNKKMLLINKCLRANLLALLSCFSLLLNAQNDTLNNSQHGVSGNVNVGMLSIVSEPENEAAVYIDDVLVGYTPFMKKVAVGEHKLCVKKEHYYDYVENIEVSDVKMVKKVRLDLMFGYVQVSSSPIGAMVLINDQETTLMTPCTTDKIVPGRVKVSLELEDYQTFDTILEVEENLVSRLYVVMKRNGSYNNVSNDEYYNQLFSDTTRLATMLASDMISQGIYDSIRGKKKVIKPKLEKRYVFRVKRENELGIGVWLKMGTGMSGIWGVNESEGLSTFKCAYPNFYAGGQLTYRFNRYIGLGLDIMYTRIGYYETYKPVDNNGLVYTYNYKFAYNNIDFPLLARVYFQKNGLGPMLEIGPMINYRIDYNQTEDYNGVSVKRKFSYNACNFSVVGGIGYDFKIGKVVCTANFRSVLELTRIYGNAPQKFYYLQLGLGVKVY